MYFQRTLSQLLNASLLTSLIVISTTANAVPSFARQTGQPCAACHIGAFGPQLTPFGTRFKLNGYTMTDGKGEKIPLSAMLVEGFTHTKKSQTEDAQPHFGKNDNLSLQELSVFLAGRMTDHIGTFIQVTGNDFDRRFALDNADIRFADSSEISDKSLVYGISINNNPTIQDPFNSLSGWKFPYMSSELAPSPAASPFINGALEQQVIGASAYALYDDHFYIDLGGYKTLSKSLRANLNEGVDGKIKGVSPYWRLSYLNSVDNQNYRVGLFGMNTKLQPDFLSGPTDNYRDIGIDGSYQLVNTNDHIFTINTSYVNERRTLNNAFDAGGADSLHGSLKRFDLAGSYNYQNTYGASLGVFDMRGNRDDALYNNGEADSGSISGSPNSRGYILQADWTPWGKQGSWVSPYANMRLGAQYTGYTKFNGAKNNYDGLGRSASDNNTLFLFAWFAI